ncbi:hypothetical protein GJ496_008834 [Pomphorhynchus laevis]|nr:hypothetical protein GJ496_011935 [Pomphorhynchus laevis]KAI0988646.1 hypothetical protein GJ496_006345 [Pomphorhynchus laevis]KAI0988723.1 hypothetical protein GJ496_008834 [Pomphorhynchus laevis]
MWNDFNALNKSITLVPLYPVFAIVPAILGYLKMHPAVLIAAAASVGSSIPSVPADYITHLSWSITSSFNFRERPEQVLDCDLQFQMF